MDILIALTPIFGIVILGMLACRTGFFLLTSSATLNQFTYRVALPSLLFSRIVHVDAAQISFTIVYSVLLALFFTYVFSYLFFIVVLRKGRRQAVVFTLLSNFYNAGFMGIPIVVLLFPGDSTLMTVSILVTIFSIFIIFTADAQLQYIDGAQGSLLSFIQKVGASLLQSPTIVAAIAGFLWNISGAPHFQPLFTMMAMLGAAAAPSALFCIGMILITQLSSSEGFVPGWFLEHLPVHIIKLILQPLAVYYFLIFFGESGKIIGAIVILTCMPTGIAAYIVAEKYPEHTRDMSLDIFVNTTLSIITIPIAAYLLRLAGDI